MGYSRKNPNRGIEGMLFPGVLRNSIWNFQGLIKKTSGNPKIKKNLCETGVSLFGLGISGKQVSVTQFCGISMGEALFCPEFPGVK